MRTQRQGAITLPRVGKNHLLNLLTAGVCVAGLLATACSDEKEPLSATVTLSAVFEQPAEGMDFKWSDDDAVSINGSSYTLASGGGSASGSFKEVPRAGKYIALRPASAFVSAAGNSITLNLPAVQQYAAGNYATTYPMIASSTDENLTFRSLAGVLELKVTHQVPLRTITVQAKAGEKLAGAAVADADKPDLHMVADAVDAVQLDCGEGIAPTQTASVLHIVIPSRKYSQGLALRISDTDGGTMDYDLPQAVTVTPGNIASVPEFVYKADPVAKADWLWMTSDNLIGGVRLKADAAATDLSAGSTFANCYVVPQAGSYQFKAVLPDGSAIEGLPADTWISFTASEAKGNAVIAALDETGKIVWSWHIWLTDTPADFACPSTGGRANVVLMDRNIGAVAAMPTSKITDTYGMMYQWGRKDPFYAGAEKETVKTSFDRARENTIVNPLFAELGWKTVDRPKVEGGVDIAYAIHNPMSFVYTTDKKIQDWLIPQNDELWTVVKSIYDPCPAGYRVPQSGDFFDMWVGPLTWDKTFFGRMYTHPTSGETLWFPSQGMRWGDDFAGFLSTVRSNGMHWSCTPAKDATNVYSKIFSFTATNADTQYGRNYYRIMGFAVRCCKE